MPIPEKYLADFDELGVYHVFNRTNNREKLFLSDENRHFFLRKYTQHLSAYLDTFCWCLLPNHFHFLVRVKASEKILTTIKKIASRDLSLTEKKFQEQECTLNELIVHGFKRFFQSYSLSFNKVHKRNGNLFYKPFKRVAVEKETHFTQAVVYVHANPVRHGLLKDFKAYKWSSWQTLIADGETQLLRKELWDWFGNKESFIKTHEELTKYYYESEISIEE